jgi:hypothetical protein
MKNTFIKIPGVGGGGEPQKQENYLHENFHVGKSNIIIMGILVEHQKTNFLHGKTI